MPKILVAGELNADLILSGLPSLPVLGRELLGTGFAMVLGSSSAITAARLAALGADDLNYAVDFVGLVGNDDVGRFVLRQLEAFGVNHDAVTTVDTATGVTISLTYERDRALLTYPGAMTLFDGAAITPELLARYTHLHVGSFFLQTGLQPHLGRIFAAAGEVGVTTSLDVGWDPSETWMRNPSLASALAEVEDFLPNEDECRELVESRPSPPNSLSRTAVGGELDPSPPTPLPRKRGEGSDAAVKTLVRGTLWVKRGGRGASVYADGQAIHAPAFPVNPVDTTGAGDAFNAGAIYARRIRGETIESALKFAAACGAEATLHVGGATAAPTEQTIRAWMAERENRT